MLADYLKDAEFCSDPLLIDLKGTPECCVFEKRKEREVIFKS